MATGKHRQFLWRPQESDLVRPWTRRLSRQPAAGLPLYFRSVGVEVGVDVWVEVGVDAGMCVGVGGCVSGYVGVEVLV